MVLICLLESISVREHWSLRWPLDKAVSGLTIMVRGSKPGSNINFFKLHTFRHLVHFYLSQSHESVADFVKIVDANFYRIQSI